MKMFNRVGVVVLFGVCVFAVAVFLYYGNFVGNNSAGVVVEEHIAKTTDDVACLEKQLKEVEKKMSHVYQALDSSAESQVQGELSRQKLEHELMVLTDKISNLLEDHKQILATVENSNKKTMYQKFKMTLENAFVARPM